MKQQQDNIDFILALVADCLNPVHQPMMETWREVADLSFALAPYSAKRAEWAMHIQMNFERMTRGEKAETKDGWLLVPATILRKRFLPENLPVLSDYSEAAMMGKHVTSATYLKDKDKVMDAVWFESFRSSRVAPETMIRFSKDGEIIIGFFPEHHTLTLISNEGSESLKKPGMTYHDIITELDRFNSRVKDKVNLRWTKSAIREMLAVDLPAKKEERPLLSEMVARLSPHSLSLLTKKEQQDIALVSKMLVWQEEYQDTVSWEKFRENYFKCDTCGGYDDEPCICYAR